MKRRRPPHSTVPATHPPKRHVAKVVRPKPGPRTAQPLPKVRVAHPPAPKPVRPRSVVGHIIDDSERSLADVVDNLLNQGVMLNAEIILALANVDLVYLRLSALLCAADRVLPGRGHPA